MTPDVADPKVRRQMIDDAKDDEQLTRLRDAVLSEMNGLIKETPPGNMVSRTDYESLSIFLGEIEAEQNNRVLKEGDG